MLAEATAQIGDPQTGNTDEMDVEARKSPPEMDEEIQTARTGAP